MKIVIIDERKGDVMTPEMTEAVACATTVYRIQADGHVEVTKERSKEKVSIKATFFEAHHRDQISSQKSRDMHERIQAEKHAGEPQGYSEAAMQRARHALGSEA